MYYEVPDSSGCRLPGPGQNNKNNNKNNKNTHSLIISVQDCSEPGTHHHDSPFIIQTVSSLNHNLEFEGFVRADPLSP